MAWVCTRKNSRFTVGQIVLASERLDICDGYFERFTELQITEINLFGRYSLADEYGNIVLQVPEDKLILPEEKEIYIKKEKKFELIFVLFLLICFIGIGFGIYLLCIL